MVTVRHARAQDADAPQGEDSRPPTPPSLRAREARMDRAAVFPEPRSVRSVTLTPIASRPHSPLDDGGVAAPATRYHSRTFGDGRREAHGSKVAPALVVEPRSAPVILASKPDPLKKALQNLAGLARDAIVPTAGALQRTVTHVPPVLDDESAVVADPTVLGLLRRQPAHAVAIRSHNPAHPPATYGDLLAFVTKRVSWAAYGIAPGDTVVTVLPDGPLSAVAFLAIANHATAAPLNPAAPTNELVDAVAQIFPKAVLTTDELWPVVAPVVEEVNRLALQAAGDHSKAVVVSLVVVRDASERDFAGSFDVASRPATGPEAEAAFAARRHRGASETAILLRTSGTTSRPKVVPLALGAVVRNGAAIAAALRLTPGDVCINAMPLFHIGGLSASVLATLAAGASAILMPGFKPQEFADAIALGAPEPRPTWYSAVPTIHLALMQHVESRPGGVGAMRHTLRLIRSGAASLSHESALKLRGFWNVPVVPSYSMTEQMPIAQCPLDYDPAAHPGTVGVPMVNIKIVDENGKALPRSDAYPIVGEICISGDTVMGGYLDNDEANGASFFRTRNTNAKYFRTGDLGYVDGDGYLYLSGRAKELIKVGGEQVSPFEVEDVLHKHSDVHIALACGIPNELLGEVTGAVVVLRESARSRPERDVLAEIKQLCVSEGLPPIKVPRLAVAREEDLPRGPTRKFLRNKLAEAFFAKSGGGARKGAGQAPDGAGKAAPPAAPAQQPREGVLSDATLGIRLILSLIVCLNHIGDHAWPHEGDSVHDHTRFSAAVTSMRVVGDLGVVMFGMLAGFSLTVSMTQAVPKGRYLRFYESRLVPIHLVYLVATLLCAVNRLFFCPPDKFGRYEYGSVEACRATIVDFSWGGTWLSSILVNLFSLQAWPIGLFVWHISYYTWFSSAYQFCVFCYPYIHRMLEGRERPGKLAWTHVWLQVAHLLTLVFMESVYLSTKADAEWANYFIWAGYMFPPFWAIRFACGCFLGFQFKAYRPDRQATAWVWGVITDAMTFVTLLAYVLMIHFGFDIHARFSKESYLEDRMYSGVTPRLGVPIFMVYMYGLAVGRGMTCAFLKQRWIVKLSPASYAIYLLHQPVFEWWSVLTKGEWWTRRKPFEWFSPDPIALDWWETAVVLLLVVHFSVFVTWLVDEVLMQRWLTFVRGVKEFLFLDDGAGAPAGGGGAPTDGAQDLVLDAIEDLVGVRASLDDRPGELLASLGIVALGGALASRRGGMRRLTPPELVACETVADLIDVVSGVLAEKPGEAGAGGAAGGIDGTRAGDPSPIAVFGDVCAWVKSFYWTAEDAQTSEQEDSGSACRVVAVQPRKAVGGNAV